MPTPTVWSERDEPNARGLWDCTYSAVLMCLVYAGKVDYPYGIYTVSEREALERSDSRQDETGSTFTYTDEATRNRYKVQLAKPTQFTATAIRALLNTPGIAVALAGSYRTLPSTHPWRRWQPGYEGGHAVCVIPLGNGKVLWLDPLAPWGHKGDVGTVNDAMAFAWTDNAARWIRKDSLVALPDSSMEDTVTIVEDVVRFAAPRRFSIRPGQLVNGFKAGVKVPAKSATWESASGAHADALVTITGDGSPGDYKYAHVIDGYYVGLYVPVHSILIDDTPDVVDPNPELIEEIDRLSDLVATLKASVATLRERVQRLRSRIARLKTLTGQEVDALKVDLDEMLTKITQI